MFYLGSDGPEYVSDRVKCEVCYQYRNLNKYRRHLNIHLSHGRISSTEIENIIFQSRYSRFNSRDKVYLRSVVGSAL